MSAVTAITVPGAPAPQGHYAQGTLSRGDGLIIVSGQLARRADGSQGHDAPFEEQVRQCMANLLAIVEAGGGSRDSIARVTAYIVGVENWPAFNAVYAGIMGPAMPARAVVPVPALHHGYLVEIDAIAIRERPAG
ncbi:RidA family protein [Poseidonocella sp. HB161398]|uniref:RidA family protein n=1 Tax=Poseidonocella sp. HB161398 TaxID=2320855 RepID=UPI001108DF13|nr:RidA family protein [Poseidonocella sp. HB161398]